MNAGWHIGFANDIDEDKWQRSRPFWRQPENLSWATFTKLDPGAIPDVTLATASFPCNDLSLAGARKGLAGEQSSAFWGFIDILTQMGLRRRPPLILIENVTGFLTSHDGNDFHDALAALNKLGYVLDPFIIDAGRFLPQSFRQRLFVVGIKTRDAPP